MTPQEYRAEKLARTRPCDNAPYRHSPPNAIALELGAALHSVFCDLHDQVQMDLLTQTTGLEPEALFDRLFVTDRYQVPRDDWSTLPFAPPPSDAAGNDGLLGLAAHEPLVGSSSTDLASLNPDDREFAAMLLASDGLRPALLIGPVGSGKTTFLKRFMRYVAPSTGGLNHLVFLHLDFAEDEIRGRYYRASTKGEPFDASVDFALTRWLNGYFEGRGGLPPLADILADRYAFENVERTIETWPEEVRDEQRNQWYRRTAADLGKFNCSRIHYLLERLQKRTIICLDNIDMWQVPEQEQLVRSAFYEASWYGAGLLIVVRHNALVKVQEQMAYSERRPMMKYLTPPRIDQIVERRLTLLQSIIRQSSLGPYDLEGHSLEARVKFRSPAQLLELLGEVTNGLTTGEANEFMQSFSNHNIRRMLDFVELYLSSEHAEIWRFLRGIVHPPSDYVSVGFWKHGTIGLQTIITVAALEYGPVHRPPVAFLCNLFSNDSATAAFDGLVRLRALTYVAKRDAVPQSVVVHGFESVGYEPDQVRNAIKGLSMTGLIESRGPIADAQTILTSTIAGKYYLTTLVNRFSYLQHMRDGAYMPGLKAPMGNATHLEERLLETALFLQFLDGEERAERARGVALDVSGYLDVCGSGDSMPEIARSLRTELAKIPVIKASTRRETRRVLALIEARGRAEQELDRSRAAPGH